MNGFKLLYNVYIRPHLEFCVPAWLPYLKKDIYYMEVVHRCATQMAYGFGNIKYEERLERLNLFSLQYRRMRGGCKFISVFTWSNMNNHRGHSLKL